MLLELLYAALESPFGVEVETNDVRRCIQKLYSERTKSSDPALDCLSLVSAPNGMLWIIKRPEATP